MKVFPINDKINEYDYDPNLGVGIPWIRRTTVAPTNTLSHTLLHIGLAASTTTEETDVYTLKVRNKNNEILKISLEKEV